MKVIYEADNGMRFSCRENALLCDEIIEEFSDKTSEEIREEIRIENVKKQYYKQYTLPVKFSEYMKVKRYSKLSLRKLKEIYRCNNAQNVYRVNSDLRDKLVSLQSYENKYREVALKLKLLQMILKTKNPKPVKPDSRNKQ